jgi:hypothetical protein
MYEDTVASQWSRREYHAAGIAFYPVGDWQQMSARTRADAFQSGWEEDDSPAWLLEGITIGEIPNSGNYFLIHPNAEPLGAVYYLQHDDFDEEPIAKTFDEFLNAIVTDPVGFLYRSGCYTRYADGKTDIQWIPKEYLPG